MEPQSHFLKLNNNDSIELNKDAQIKIQILREALKKVYSAEMETALQRVLLSQGIKTPYSTKIGQFYEYKNTHINNWLGNGVACRIVKSGEQHWQQGKIKIKLEIEFEPDDIQSKSIKPVQVEEEKEENKCHDSLGDSIEFEPNNLQSFEDELPEDRDIAQDLENLQREIKKIENQSKLYDK